MSTAVTNLSACSNALRRVPIRAASLALLTAAPLAQKLDFERLDYPVGASPTDTVVADLDGNGLVDVVATDTIGGRLLRLFQGPPRSFVLEPLTVGDRPDRLVAGDFDGDARVDLAVVHEEPGALGPAELWILSGDGAGGFALNEVLALPGKVGDLVAGDIDQDGDVDLVTTHPYEQAVLLLRGSGTGTFPLLETVTTTGNPTFADIGDVNADGFADVLFVQNGVNGTTDLLGTSSGVFVPGPGINTFDWAGWIHLGDVNGDGFLDMASHTSGFDDGAEVWLGGDYPNFTLFSIFANNAEAIFADLDGDGAPEHVSNHQGLETRIGLGTGQFVTPEVYQACSSSVPRVADLDADGRPDIVTHCYLKGSVSVYWQRTPVPPILTGIEPATVPSLVQEGDGVTIAGRGFTTVTKVRFDGAPATKSGGFSSAPHRYEVLDDHRLLFRPGPQTLPSSPKLLEITTQFGAVSESPKIRPPLGPVVNSLTDLTYLSGDVDLHVGAPPGGFVLLLTSPSASATTIPGVVDLGLGAGGSSLFLLWSGTISSNGWDQLVLPLADGLNVTLHFQALSLGDGSLPLPVSPVLTKQVLS